MNTQNGYYEHWAVVHREGFITDALSTIKEWTTAEDFWDQHIVDDGFDMQDSGIRVDVQDQIKVPVSDIEGFISIFSFFGVVI